MRYQSHEQSYKESSLTGCIKQVVFVDVMDKLIEQLQNTPKYTVTEIGGEGEKVNTITNYRAINSKTHEGDAVKEISSADLVSKKLKNIMLSQT